MRAMILAAGRGERMRPLTDETPKPLLRVGGKPLIQHQIEALAAAGVREIVVNLAWKGAMIRDALGDGAALGVRILYSDEGETALDTGGGVFKALPMLGVEPFLVVSADIWTDFDFGRLSGRPATRDVAHFILVSNPPFNEKGDFCLVDGRVAEAGGPRLTYANIGVFRPEFFGGCEGGRFPLAPLMYEWARKGRVSGERYEGRWWNVGTPVQLLQLDRELTAR